MNRHRAVACGNAASVVVVLAGTGWWTGRSCSWWLTGILVAAALALYLPRRTR